MNFSEELEQLKEGKDLPASKIREFFDGVCKGSVEEEQTASFLKALAEKGESPSEIAGVIEEMRHYVKTAGKQVNAPGAIDIVGTGGDGSGTFNISTAAAFVATGAGAKVAKHGNRAASSKCGSADVLEALGVNILLQPQEAEEIFKRAGMVFLMAPQFHPEMKAFATVRKALGIRTIFNIVGPFTNPAFTTRQLVGVPNERIARTIMKSVSMLNDTYEHLLIVTSEDGMDEISLSADTHAFEIQGDVIKEFVIDPSALGFSRASKSDVLGGTAEENIHIIQDILAKKPGPKRDIVVLNAAYALIVAGRARTPEEGTQMAQDSIDTGSARAALERLIAESNKFKKA